jgi:hypothetical protein
MLFNTVIKEGLERQHMIEAVMNGEIIEEYPDNQRYSFVEEQFYRKM